MFFIKKTIAVLMLPLTLSLAVMIAGFLLPNSNKTGFT